MPSPLTNFAAAAESYIDFIDSFADTRPNNLYTTLESHLANLQAAILPVVAKMNDPPQPELDDIGMSHDQWNVIAQLVSKTTAEETVVLMSWHEKIEGSDPLPAPSLRAYDLFDDLADIYRDLHSGLTLWNLNTRESKIEASWEWRYNYDIHWGSHIFRAARTIHEIRYILHKD